MKKYAIPALCAFQFHLIGRIDDTCQFMLAELATHDVHPFALRARMCWSKNVMEERQAPSQIILGAHDPDFCTLLNLGLYLEEMYPTEMNADGELNCFKISSSPASSKARVSRILKEIFDSEEFKALFGDHILSTGLEAWLGSHSLRKLVATHARRNGCSRDEIDLRGRWKKSRRIVDTYLDTTIPYPDAKVAASICVGGPIKYELVGNCGLDDDWIRQNVTPNIFKLHHCKKTAVVFGKAILWACYDLTQKDHVPVALRERVAAQYESIRLLEPNTNPVKKITLVVAGHEGQLFIDELNDPDEPASSDGSVPSTPANVSDVNRKRVRRTGEMQAIFSQLSAIRRQNDVLQSELSLTRNSLLSKLKIVSTNMNRIALIPAQVATTLNNLNHFNLTDPHSLSPQSSLNPITTGATIHPINRSVRIKEPSAKLARNLKSLYVLWHEYEFGIGERRPAKSFSRKERGSCRHLYSKRNLFWSLVVEMIRRGHTANGAIDKIYEKYGFKTSVTDILRQLQKDKKQHHRQFL